MWYLESLAPIIKKLPEAQRKMANSFIQQVFDIFDDDIIEVKPALEFYYGVIEKLHKKFANIEPNSLSFEELSHYLILFATIYVKQSEESSIWNRYIIESLTPLLYRYNLTKLTNLKQFNQYEREILKELDYRTMVDIAYVETVAEVPNPARYYVDLIFIHQNPFLLYTAIKAKLYAPNLNIVLIETQVPYKSSYDCSYDDWEVNELLSILKAISVKKTPAMIKDLLLRVAIQLGITVDQYKFEDINDLYNRYYDNPVITSSNRKRYSAKLFKYETDKTANACQTKLLKIIQNILEQKNTRSVSMKKFFHSIFLSQPKKEIDKNKRPQGLVKHSYTPLSSTAEDEPLSLTKR